MSRAPVRAAAAALCCLAAAGGCRSARLAPAPSPAPSPARVEKRAVASLAEAEPALVAREDRRAFDGPFLEAAAASPDPALRARTALALGRIGDPRPAPALKRLLADGSAEVRSSAAFAAGLLGVPELTGDLAALLADADAGVAARAAWAVGALGQPAGEEALRGALSAPAEPERKAVLVRALWRFATPTAAAAALPYASDPDGRVRTAALYALGRRPQEGSLAALTAGLGDPDPHAAAACARALGLLGREESIPPLLTLLERPRREPAGAAMAALAAILEKKPKASLPGDAAGRIVALASDADPSLAIPALVLMRSIVSDREAFRRLWNVASSGTGRRRQIALQSAMAGLREGALPLVDAAVASDDRFLRAAAAEALESLPDTEAVPRRERLAADAETVVRLRVLEGLRTPAAAGSARAIVTAALADPDAGVRAAAIEPLARLEEPDTLARMRDLAMRSYEDRAPDVPIAILDQIEKTPDAAGAREIAEALYRHPSTLVSRLAQRALVRAFHADPAAFPAREYPGRTEAEYADDLARARRPWTAVVTTDRGSFTIRLAGAEAPLTVASFLRLAESGYFDGVPVHRVIPNFVLQDGDPTGTGNGGPGYEIRDELNPLPYLDGTVGMALAGPDTGGSQWFVTHSTQPHLDGGYTVFGQVVSGLDVVRRVEQGDRILRVAVSAGP